MSDFISTQLVEKHNIPIYPRSVPLPVYHVEGLPVDSGPITHDSDLTIRLGEHELLNDFRVLKMAYPLILGIPWLRKSNPRIDFLQHTIQLPDPVHPVPVIPEPDLEIPNVRDSTVSATSLPAQPCRPVPCSIAELSDLEPPVSVSAVSIEEFQTYDPDTVGIVFVSAVDDSVPSVPDPDSLTHEEREELKRSVPREYHDLLQAFSPRSANKLAPHRPGIDLEIQLEEGKVPPTRPMIPLSGKEKLALEEWIKTELEKGFIVPSKSPAAAPVLFSTKKDGSLRLCHDFRGLNAITVKDRYPLPLINDLLDRVQGSSIFTKLDLKMAYNLIRIREGDEWKTAFRTPSGLFEMRVMPFGLTNAPACFQRFIDSILAPRRHLDTSAYLDDILIDNSDFPSHVNAVRHVLQLLITNGLYCNVKKCSFHVNTVEHLGFIISPDGISMDPAKLATIRDWPVPASVKQVQSWLGFTNFYRRFVQNYARIAHPLNDLTRKLAPGAKFAITPAALAAFEKLKETLLEAPALRHFDQLRQISVITDGSDYALSGIVHQPDDDGRLHPVAFYSRRMQPAEINYDAGDKEALAIVATFKHFRPWLLGSRHPVILLCDHLNLASLMTTKTLNRRQARWAQFLADFDFRFAHIPGTKNPADAPSRRPDYVPKEGDEHVTQQTTNLFPQSAFEHIRSQLSTPSSVSISALFTTPHSDLPERVKTAQDADQQWRQHTEKSDARFTINEGTVLYDGLLYVPEALRLETIRQHHDSPSAGHPGRAITIDLVTRNFSWPGLRRQIREYVTSCDTCQRVKADRHKPYGLLQPLPVPTRPWESVSWDFIVKLPVSKGYDSIWVIICRLSKLSHFIPCRESMDATELADLFVREVFRLHGAPRDVISDRGSTFVSAFFTNFLKRLDITPHASTAYHPQTDGQTERTNQTVEDYLRCFTSYQQDDWADHLPLAEFAYNNHKSASSQISPFFATYGFHPHAEPTTASNGTVPAADQRADSLLTIHKELQAELTHARADFTSQYNKHVQKHPESFKPGTLVWLRRRNIKTRRPSDKLDYRKIGPFKIKAARGPRAFELDLPPTLSRLHPVFHVSLLEPYHDPTQIAGRLAPPPPPLHLDDEATPLLRVDSILDCRRIGQRLEYLVRWKDHDTADDSYVPLSDLSTELDEVIEQFHRRNPNLPKPTPAELKVNLDNPRSRYAPPSQTTTRSGRVSRPRGARA